LVIDHSFSVIGFIRLGSISKWVTPEQAHT